MAGALGVVGHVESNSQAFFRGHDADLRCISQHPNEDIVASGTHTLFSLFSLSSLSLSSLSFFSLSLLSLFSLSLFFLSLFSLTQCYQLNLATN